MRGFGVVKNIQKAKEIFVVGTSLNEPNSMYHLGFILEDTDLKYSLQLYKEAAKRGHKHAQAKSNYILFKK